MLQIKAVRAKFGENVRTVLRKKNMKQKQLAQALQMHEVNLSAYLCGRNTITLQTVCEISFALQTPLVDLFAGIEVATPLVATPIVASEEARPLIFDEAPSELPEEEKERYARFKKFCEYENLFSKPVLTT